MQLNMVLYRVKVSKSQRHTLTQKYTEYPPGGGGGGGRGRRCYISRFWVETIKTFASIAP